MHKEKLSLSAARNLMGRVGENGGEWERMNVARWGEGAWSDMYEQ